MNYNPTPKSQFAGVPENVKKHHALVQDDRLRYAMDCALADYNRQLCSMNATDLGSCASLHLRMKGAQELAEIFFNLAEVPAIPKLDVVGNLPGNQPQKVN